MSSTESRWWEFYGIRYAMGTVVGGLIVYLIFSQSSHLQGVLLIPENTGDFGFAHLALLAAYGLAYCYLASGPVLVLHMARTFLWPESRPKPRDRFNFYAAILAPAAIVGAVYWWSYPTSDPSVIWHGVVPGIFGGALSLQVVLLRNVFRNRAKAAIGYYESIVQGRARPEMKEFVESYRHLREHGNSFMIVFFEAWLGLVLYTAVATATSADAAVASVCTILFLWAAPSTMAWFFGNRLEYSLTQSSGSDH